MADRRPIAVLPEDVAERIAAGEVVERPTSVVRELLDNAIDAGAAEISIEVRGGGIELIRVADDGVGIPPDELQLAFVHHATSKIGGLEDLLTLGTLGFRGEALPSIAAVAELEMLSRDAEATSAMAITLRAGAVLRRRHAARTRGTTVTVRHLFHNVPARLKFTPASRAETLVIGRLVRRYALAHPGIRFTLVVDGRPSFRSSGGGRLEVAMAEVYGPGVGAALIPLRVETGAGAVRGLVSARTVTRPGRDDLTLIVNRRWVVSRALGAAIEAAYRPFLPRGRHPIGVIALDLPPAEIDPNVHPAKIEVRLLREEEVGAAIADAVRALYERTPAGVQLDAELALGPGQFPLRVPGRHVAESRAPFGSHASGADPVGNLAEARIVGQVHGSLILLETDHGLLLVDQHRAHERIIFEQLRRNQEQGAPEAQTLLEPVVLELKPHQAELLDERLSGLEGLGLSCERIGGHAFLVRAIPAIPGQENVAAQLRELIEEAASREESWRERLVVSLACRAAVRRGRALTAADMTKLVRDLAATSAPVVCPHGSPLILRIDERLLAKQFDW